MTTVFYQISDTLQSYRVKNGTQYNFKLCMVYEIDIVSFHVLRTLDIFLWTIHKFCSFSENWIPVPFVTMHISLYSFNSLMLLVYLFGIDIVLLTAHLCHILFSIFLRLRDFEYIFSSKTTFSVLVAIPSSLHSRFFASSYLFH